MPSDDEEEDDSDDETSIPNIPHKEATSSNDNIGSEEEAEKEDGASTDGDDDDDSEEGGEVYGGISSDEDDDSNSDEDDDEEVRLRRLRNKPLCEISMADRLALKMDGGDGAKSSQRRHKPVITAWQKGGDNARGNWGKTAAPEETDEAKGRKRKDAPMEMSTKWAVGRHREVVEVKKKKSVDPRFWDASEGGGGGGGSKKAQAEMMEFLDEKRATELKAVEHAIKKEKRRRGGRESASADTKVEVLKQTAYRLKQVQGEHKRTAVADGALAEWRKGERTKVAEGKQPFFLKRAAVKELVKNRQFEELIKGKGGKQRGEKHMEKKQKKKTAKERKWVPDERGASGAAGF